MRRISDDKPPTTSQLLREIETLEKLTTQRMDAIEKAVAVAHENLVRVPTEVQKAIGHLHEVMVGMFTASNEKFSGIQTQFRERDVRTEQSAKAAQVGLDAALQAAEKAVGKQNDSFSLSIAKSETATNKQIDQLQQLLVSNQNATNGQISDVKERLTRIEGRGTGRSDIWGILVGAVAAIAAVVAIVIAFSK